MKRTNWPGNWKVACHVCGMWYPSSEIRKRWDGVLCCPKDWETRHPQTMIRVHGERAVPDFVSKDANPDQFVAYCDITTRSAYADLGTTDCMTIGNTTYSYDFLHGLNTNGHGSM